MSMTEWAENEIELAKACKTEDGEFDEYITSCYDSALRAYKSLMEDEHSGMSFSITRTILKKLMNEEPLTPIEDTPDIWGKSHTQEDGTEIYQCARRSPLFKEVHPDGTITFTDNDRILCKYDYNESFAFYNGYVADIVNKMFPITLPYSATDHYSVLVDDFQMGDLDVRGLIEVKAKDGTITPLDIYYTSDENNTLIEISKEEFEKLKKEAVNEESI